MVRKSQADTNQSKCCKAMHFAVGNEQESLHKADERKAGVARDLKEFYRTFVGTPIWKRSMLLSNTYCLTFCANCTASHNLLILTIYTYDCIRPWSYHVAALSLKLSVIPFTVFKKPSSFSFQRGIDLVSQLLYAQVASGRPGLAVCGFGQGSLLL
eukprot:1144331-Pelagomonas_calceolata.AAC.3